MKKIVALCASLALVACDKQSKIIEQPKVESGSLVIGKGQLLTRDKTKVMIGPMAIDERNNTGSIPVFVSDGPPLLNAKRIGITCILFDIHNELVSSTGDFLPGKFSGGELPVRVNRDMRGGRVQCQLVDPGAK